MSDQWKSKLRGEQYVSLRNVQGVLGRHLSASTAQETIAALQDDALVLPPFVADSLSETVWLIQELVLAGVVRPLSRLVAYTEAVQDDEAEFVLSPEVLRKAETFREALEALSTLFELTDSTNALLEELKLLEGEEATVFYFTAIVKELRSIAEGLNKAAVRLGERVEAWEVDEKLWQSKREGLIEDDVARRLDDERRELVREVLDEFIRVLADDGVVPSGWHSLDALPPNLKAEVSRLVVTPFSRSESLDIRFLL